MLSLEEYESFDAQDLMRLLASRQISSADLAQSAALAIDTWNPQLNAVAEVYHDRVDGANAETFRATTYGGVPILMKDAGAAEKGRAQNWGSRLAEGQKVSTDSSLATAIRKTGLNIIGRTTSPELTIAATTESNLYGATSNPWNHALSAGGSSGGAAAAVASGMVPIAHGTDTGGSIRIPAACCGVIGFKPSRAWFFPYHYDEETVFAGLNTNFFVTRSVRDTSAILRHLSRTSSDGVEGEQSATNEWPSVNIGLLSNLTRDEPTEPIAAAMRECCSELISNGISIDECALDLDAQKWAWAETVIWALSINQLCSSLSNQSGRPCNGDYLEPVTLGAISASAKYSSTCWFSAIQHCELIRRSVDALFETYDFLLLPTISSTAPELGYLGTNQKIEFDDFFKRTYAFAPYTSLFNISGHPAVSIPRGLGSDGMPVSVQLVGPLGADMNVLQLAERLHIPVSPYSATTRLPLEGTP